MLYALRLLNELRQRLDHKVKADQVDFTSMSCFNVRMVRELALNLNIRVDRVNKEGITQFLDSVCVQRKQRQMTRLQCRKRKSWLLKAITAWEQRTL